jgi:hypothetical protein
VGLLYEQSLPTEASKSFIELDSVIQLYNLTGGESHSFKGGSKEVNLVFDISFSQNEES